MNAGLRSLITSSGSPWWRQTCSRNNWATPAESKEVTVGMVNPLGQAIHHHEDGIVSLGVREFSNHVYRDHLPASIRDLVRDQLPHLLCREGLRLVACIASCDELGDIPAQPWPPVVLRHQF